MQQRFGRELQINNLEIIFVLILALWSWVAFHFYLFMKWWFSWDDWPRGLGSNAQLEQLFIYFSASSSEGGSLSFRLRFPPIGAVTDGWGWAREEHILTPLLNTCTPLSATGAPLNEGTYGGPPGWRGGLTSRQTWSTSYFQRWLPSSCTWGITCRCHHPREFILRL